MRTALPVPRYACRSKVFNKVRVLALSDCLAIQKYKRILQIQIMALMVTLFFWWIVSNSFGPLCSSMFAHKAFFSNLGTVGIRAYNTYIFFTCAERSRNSKNNCDFFHGNTVFVYAILLKACHTTHCYRYCAPRSPYLSHQTGHSPG